MTDQLTLTGLQQLIQEQYNEARKNVSAALDALTDTGAAYDRDDYEYYRGQAAILSELLATIKLMETTPETSEATQ